MVTTPVKTLSLAEFMALPETKPAQEYINGTVREKPRPKGKHSLLQTLLSASLNQTLSSQRRALALSELRCTFGDRSIVPDIAVFTQDRIPRDSSGEIVDLFDLAPDWTIEILSPDQSPVRVIKNILSCLENGTQMGWLVDPKEQTILVYRRDKQVQVIDKLPEIVPVPTFADDFQISVGELFAWLM
ncbi:Uma2 family endonuclease [Synechocystis salina]|uniref:Uma2 family endonuclease n=1 Tax=Synechocystis salina LEGE 00031 TaxID=1828736 RepID=A0ABR9VU55_9SYNC|nr:Uma2 family endonuclease [Synechocystis salina]MBE9241626.1 Uma2 family endonuclease [Synechocystis salina LEGE 00041]MBE9254879.1 Uma2 family endonuclease [Synechocystis salina LEGE 00031]